MTDGFKTCLSGGRKASWLLIYSSALVDSHI